MSDNDNIIHLDNITYNDIPPDTVLEAAMGKLDQCVIVGLTKDGRDYFAYSPADKPTVLWMLEHAKNDIMKPEEEY